MNESNVWWINIVCNLGLGVLLLGIVRWFLLRFIEELDKKFKDISSRVEKTEKEIDEIRENYIGRFDDVKEHFTNKISSLIDDKNNYRIGTSGILSQVKEKIENLSIVVYDIKRKVFGN